MLDETLVVLTTDHAQLTSRALLRPRRRRAGATSTGTTAPMPTRTYLDPQPEIQRLIDETSENVETSMQDSAIRTWLIDQSLRRQEAGGRT